MKKIVTRAVAAVLLLGSTSVFAISNPPVQLIFNETVDFGHVSDVAPGLPITGCIPPRESPMVPANRWCMSIQPSTYGPFRIFNQWKFWCMPYQCVFNITFTGNYGPSGFVRPKFQVVGVYYAPPGAHSTVEYDGSFTGGVSTSAQDSFIFGTSVSITATEKWGIVDFNKGLSTTFTNGWSQELDTSTSVQVTTTLTTKGSLNNNIYKVVNLQ